MLQTVPTQQHHRPNFYGGTTGTTTLLWSHPEHKAWGKARNGDAGEGPGAEGNLMPDHLQEVLQNSSVQPHSFIKAH